jgi:hypothetical protein
MVCLQIKALELVRSKHTENIEQIAGICSIVQFFYKLQSF